MLVCECKVRLKQTAFVHKEKLDTTFRAVQCEIQCNKLKLGLLHLMHVLRSNGQACARESHEVWINSVIPKSLVSQDFG